MLSEGGKVSVMDFGLARTLESTGLTQAGALIGTPAYMSPEQALGNPVDVRSDLFSLGIIFYEMVTGIVPYKADTVLASMLKRTQGNAPAPFELDAAIPKDVSDVVLKCLATDPANRYQIAGDLLSDLDILAAQYGFKAVRSRSAGADRGRELFDPIHRAVQFPGSRAAAPSAASTETDGGIERLEMDRSIGERGSLDSRRNLRLLEGGPAGGTGGAGDVNDRGFQ